jgi:hypothetical protein
MGMRALFVLAALPLAGGAGCARDPLRAGARSDGAAGVEASGGDVPGDQLIVLDHDAPALQERPPPAPIVCPGSDTRVELTIDGAATVMRTLCPPSTFPGRTFEAGAVSHTAWAGDEGGTPSFFVYACGAGGSTFDLTIALENIDQAGLIFRGATLLARDGAGNLGIFPTVVNGTFDAPVPNHFDDDTGVGTVFAGTFVGQATQPATGLVSRATGRFEACHVWNNGPPF